MAYPDNGQFPPNYRCPLCETPSELIIGPTQAFCTNDDCLALTFNPSLPDRGLSSIHVVGEVE